MIFEQMICDDGYIKYSAEHSSEPLPADDPLQIEELLKTRDYLHKTGLVGVYPNGIGFGNCSFRRVTRYTQESSFIITGSATGEIENLQKNHLCLVEKFDIAKNLVFSKGEIQASSESMTHGAIYSANPKINCVLHIHSRKLFDRLRQLSLENTGKIYFTAKDIPYGTPEMAFAVMDEVKKIKKPNGIIVMLGHDEGVISFGETISAALAEIENVIRD
jgi:ribulose-5-phosphate 4-epimerase/fuculose-1-phosphate aldolase